MFWDQGCFEQSLQYQELTLSEIIANIANRVATCNPHFHNEEDVRRYLEDPNSVSAELRNYMGLRLVLTILNGLCKSAYSQIRKY